MRRFFRIAWCRLRGLHGADLDGWGYGMAGIVDLYCDNCGAKFAQTPLDDFEDADYVLDLIHGENGGWRSA